MRDFGPFREAARQGILDAGMVPVLIEDRPSLDASSRTACLDLVQSSDIYLLVVGDRTGSSPLGKPVVEEEFEEARRRKLPRLLFLQNTTRDEETETMVTRLSDYVAGRFRATFQSPDELRRLIGNALRELSSMNIQNNDPSMIQQLLEQESADNGPVLRLAFVPERRDEVFDILDFDSRDFQRSMFHLCHAEDVRLFDFEQGPNEATVEECQLVLRQHPRRGTPPEIGVTIRVTETGAVVVDQTLGARTRDRQHLGFDMQIAQADVTDAIRASVAFVNTLYEERDPGHRYATFFFGAAVTGMNLHFVVPERRQRNSWSLRMDDERGWNVLDKTRKVDRTDLSHPRELIDRTIAFITKRYGERS